MTHSALAALFAFVSGRVGAARVSLPPARASTITASRAKRGFDVLGALAALVFLAPLFVITAIALLVMQGRPLLIRHTRIGKDGRAFPCFKFRSMVVDADEVLQRHLQISSTARAEWNASRKLRCDPRITELGGVLRKSSVDELPQIINVLRGEMSLVGPRPIIAAEMPLYGEHLADYLRTRPGLTGAWQVSGRNDVSYDARVRLDADYVRNWSFARDMVIIMRTVPAVLRSRGTY